MPGTMRERPSLQLVPCLALGCAPRILACCKLARCFIGAGAGARLRLGHNIATLHLTEAAIVLAGGKASNRSREP